MKISRINIAALFTGILVIIIGSYYSCSSSARLAASFKTDTLYTNVKGKGELLEIDFQRGPEHNHPLMVVWIEDIDGNYIQTLYVAESIAKGVFGHGDKTTGKWLPGPIRRPAALPVWAHSRGVQEEDGLYIPTEETAIPDAYTGATPPAHFILLARADNTLPEKFYVYFEINQTWDWNKFWTNNKYPDDDDYKTSCQPALVYRALISKSEMNGPKSLELIGHSHYNGSNGEIDSDLSTITTAKEITKSISVRIIK
jgi:hypothetical protein